MFTRRTLMAGGAATVATFAHTQVTVAQTPSVTDTEREAILSALETMAQHGLDPADYRRGGSDPVRAWKQAGAHLLRGRLDPVSVEPDWTAPRRTADIDAAFDAARAKGDFAGGLESLAPKQAGYGALLAELARVRALSGVAQITVPAGPSLKEGQSGARVEAMQAALAARGFAPASPLGTFDAATADALRAFQDDAGLDADAVAGPATLAALNRSGSDRVEALRVNLERWRWLPDDLGRRHLRVNIAGFRTDAWEDGAIAQTHLAIVGKPFRKTPVFSDAVRYIVLNPWWETPASLARADKLPLFKRDPGAVQRLGFQVLDRNGQLVSNVDWNAVPAGTMPYRIRQAPGPANALGQVKIMFPNRHNVYLHDTPTRDLFARRQRAFSSGCIRTQDPIGLSKWLLRDTPGWDAARIDAAVESGKETRADLSATVPVHILYNTVVAEEGGGIRYLDDIYGRDAKVLAGLDAGRA